MLLFKQTQSGNRTEGMAVWLRTTEVENQAVVAGGEHIKRGEDAVAKIMCMI